MSVYIKGMEMPETCDECPCHHYHSAGKYVCEATPMFYPWNLANIKGARKEWCPLVELPARHGRLIDADELESMCGEPYWSVSLGKIENAPTIIEAEEVSE